MAAAANNCASLERERERGRSRQAVGDCDQKSIQGAAGPKRVTVERELQKGQKGQLKYLRIKRQSSASEDVEEGRLQLQRQKTAVLLG